MTVGDIKLCGPLLQWTYVRLSLLIPHTDKAYLTGPLKQVM